ncbi:non-hydrolyzing UDP-N-acetylglucosamine 2-epimerase [Pontibacter vulgaris]|uniref:non-hydrolyzing UDP-N-acetylglucosamine 2-epimerase n=1 Tax=Pontibacter vulgaris TaxID=2905679 RepID=UPI001FA6F34B|nr:UDP-N-acetylglucosamine 2-epimerase (non-hydrolyzing) [Pontibacter vulgaris]
MKIVTVIGARPQFIKAAAVSRALKKYSAIEEIILHTGQHFDENMSKVFFDELEIPAPNYFLDVNGGGHGVMTGRMLEKIEEILQVEQPDFVLVYGDTNSTLAGALAAKKLHIRVIHVEAGLRSFNMRMPEEVNRILTDRISDLLFCPTDTAVNNLHNEAFEALPVRIIKNGDVMQDAAIYYQQKISTKNSIREALSLDNYILTTIHRAENTDDPERLKNIIDALNEVNKLHLVVLPLHPRTKKILETQGIKPEFMIIEPVGYLDMIQLITGAKLIMTDSGGLQKEAFFFKKNCVTLRDETEWVELVDNGMNILAGSDKHKIVSSAQKLLNHTSDFSLDLYGGGKASELIAQEILNYAN